MASTEAEYMAIGVILKDILWLRRILRFISDKRRTSLCRLHVDNQGALALSRNRDFHRKSKHIDTKFHRIREEQEDGKVSVTYVETTHQAADPLTKPLNGPAMDRPRYLPGLQTLTREKVLERNERQVEDSAESKGHRHSLWD